MTLGITTKEKRIHKSLPSISPNILYLPHRFYFIFSINFNFFD